MHQMIYGRFEVVNSIAVTTVNHREALGRRQSRGFIQELKIMAEMGELTSGYGTMRRLYWPSVTLAGGGGRRWTWETPIWSSAAGAASQGTAPWLRTLSNTLAGS